MISLLFEINSARYEMMRKKEQKTDDSVLEDDFEDE